MLQRDLSRTNLGELAQEQPMEVQWYLHVHLHVDTQEAEVGLTCNSTL